MPPTLSLNGQEGVQQAFQKAKGRIQTEIKELTQICAVNTQRNTGLTAANWEAEMSASVGCLACAEEASPGAGVSRLASQQPDAELTFTPVPLLNRKDFYHNAHVEIDVPELYTVSQPNGLHLKRETPDHGKFTYVEYRIKEVEKSKTFQTRGS